MSLVDSEHHSFFWLHLCNQLVIHLEFFLSFALLTLTHCIFTLRIYLVTLSFYLNRPACRVSVSPRYWVPFILNNTLNNTYITSHFISVSLLSDMKVKVVYSRPSLCLVSCPSRQQSILSTTARSPRPPAQRQWSGLCSETLCRFLKRRSELLILFYV